eukprot:5742534-Pleurochrysis_carterae.AAC.1
MSARNARKRTKLAPLQPRTHAPTRSPACRPRLFVAPHPRARAPHAPLFCFSAAVPFSSAGPRRGTSHGGRWWQRHSRMVVITPWFQCD